MEDYNMTFYENIRNFRIFRNITQEQLSEALGVTKSAVSNWERGVNSPDIDSCVQMCRIFSVTPNEFFGWEENQEYVKWLENSKQLEVELENMKKERAAMDKRINEYAKRIAIAKRENYGKS